MAFGLRQAFLLGAGGALLAAVVVVLARRQLISLRYALGWTTIAITGASAALLIPLIEPFARLFGMSPTGVLLVGVTGVLLAITLQLSVSVSGLQSQVRDLAESNALLARELKDNKNADST